MIKNNVISISGEPVTGKSSNIRAIKQKLIEKGFKEENIHIISAGHRFREYFNEILNFIKSYDNDEKLKEMYDEGVIKEIIENPEYRSTLTKVMAKLKSMDIMDSVSIEQAFNRNIVVALSLLRRPL